MNQNLGDLMQQAQKMQERMQKMQEELSAQKVIGKAGGVEVEMLCNHQVVNIRFTDERVLSDKKILAGSMTAAINNANHLVNEKSKEFIGTLADGFNLPDFLKDQK